MKTKRILFKAYNDNNWMGAVYYVKNIVYQFLEYAKTDDTCRYEVYIYTQEEKADLFDFCKDHDNVHFLYSKNRPWSTGEGFITRNIRELEWTFRIYGKRIDYIYPNYSPKSLYRKKNISWIPDFQHVFYPDFFSEEEIAFRDSYFEEIALNHSHLVLSSQDAYDAYKTLYPEHMNGVGVVHFVSAIDEKDTENNIADILSKYHIEDDNFFLISNQFYRHKNHKCVIEAVRHAKEETGTELNIICTGLTKDIKDPTFFPEIEELIDKYDLNDNVHILGLIPREDQLTLMRHAIAVVQPSYFEGWGTCTEDAKALGKITVLSDIPVHREQADDRTLFFDKEDHSGLSGILCDLWSRYYGNPKQYEYGIRNAAEYGRQFALLCDK